MFNICTCVCKYNYWLLLFTFHLISLFISLYLTPPDSCSYPPLPTPAADMKTAYKQGDGKKIAGRRVLVDVERGRTVRNSRPNPNPKPNPPPPPPPPTPHPNPQPPPQPPTPPPHPTPPPQTPTRLPLPGLRRGAPPLQDARGRGEHCARRRRRAAAAAPGPLGRAHALAARLAARPLLRQLPAGRLRLRAEPRPAAGARDAARDAIEPHPTLYTYITRILTLALAEP